MGTIRTCAIAAFLLIVVLARVEAGALESVPFDGNSSGTVQRGDIVTLSLDVEPGWYYVSGWLDSANSTDDYHDITLLSPDGEQVGLIPGDIDAPAGRNVYAAHRKNAFHIESGGRYYLQIRTWETDPQVGYSYDLSVEDYVPVTGVNVLSYPQSLRGSVANDAPIGCQALF